MADLNGHNDANTQAVQPKAVKSQIQRERIAQELQAENKIIKQRMAKMGVKFLIFVLLIPFKIVGLFIEYVVLGGSSKPSSRDSAGNFTGSNGLSDRNLDSSFGRHRDHPSQGLLEQ